MNSLDQTVSYLHMAFPMMGSRIDWATQSVDVYSRTGQLLVGWSNNHYVPIPVGDDIGIFILVPLIAKLLGFSADSALGFILLATTVASSVAAILQSFFLYSGLRARLYAATMIVVTMATALLLTGDIYVFGAAAAITLLPVCVMVSMRSTPLGYTWLAPMFAFGLIAGVFNICRSQSGLGPLLAVGIAIALHRATTVKMKAAILSSLVAGIVIITAASAHITEKRDAFIESQRGDYQPIPSTHPFWHSVYIGFGFLSNPYGIAYNDDVAMDAAKRINPRLAVHETEAWQYDIKAHEQALKQATLDLAKSHPFFVIKSLFAKAGVCSLFLFLFGNIGLVCLPRLIRRYELSLPFFVALALGIAPGILVQPMFNYLSSFIAGVVICTATSIHLWEPSRKATF